MKSRKLIVKNKTGLHARPASRFVQLTSKFNSDIKLLFNGVEANAKSLLGVLSLGISQGSEIKIMVKGDDEQEALNQLAEYIEKVLPMENC